MNENDLMIKIVEGLARVEAKLDAHLASETEFMKRFNNVEQEVHMMQGERRFVKFWTPIICGAVSLIVSLLSHVLLK